MENIGWLVLLICITVLGITLIITGYNYGVEVKDNNYLHCLDACDDLEKAYHPAEYVDCIKSCNLTFKKGGIP